MSRIAGPRANAVHRLRVQAAFQPVHFARQPQVRLLSVIPHQNRRPDEPRTHPGSTQRNTGEGIRAGYTHIRQARVRHQRQGPMEPRESERLSGHDGTGLPRFADMPRRGTLARGGLCD